jgi:hypothetical protein
MLEDRSVLLSIWVSLGCWDEDVSLLGAPAVGALPLRDWTQLLATVELCLMTLTPAIRMVLA